MMQKYRRMRVAQVFVLASAAIAASSCGAVTQPAPPKEAAAAPVSPIDPQKYYAVLLNNGTVYYGKLDGYATSYPTLRDVFYIQRAVSPQTKQLSNILVKRGKELHAPDLMILNPQAITFIEPVGAGSKVAQLIDQAHQQQ